ncbi:MAG TPA: GerMN domain-containing protein [Dehalococcoidia bacterium]|nr:GerMN domain-containing protein [Dehalococcoidia bacterium]
MLLLALLLCLPAALALGRRSVANARAQPAATVSHVIVYWGNMYTPYDANNPLGLAPVLMFTDRADVATFTLEQYFKGPGSEIAAAGFFPDVDTGALTDGKVFTLALDNGVATVDIVQPISFYGDLSEPRMQMAITWMLTQFKTIDSVSILLNGQPLPGLR